MSRDSDIHSSDPAQVELGHVHERLKTLEEGQGEVQKALQAVQYRQRQPAGETFHAGESVHGVDESGGHGDGGQCR